ncbi:hypothetical protein MQE23_42895 [Streptomyces sp. HP-A2021]|uniref:hypothetical protein n=1 Tax=Streptomyces sp. HP-A2021 TaxID=2927875 RepID=UPI001FAF757C|nr:hypothetical protein [Streptomyces sp. HP-A2021]UOB15375.1 hypothetical protein MQE23_42895 [Streptomyces sp. HP-A2021]
MGLVLTTASTVTCGHTPPQSVVPPPPGVPGLIKASSSKKLKVKDNSVLVRASLQGLTVQNCPLDPSVSCKQTVTLVTGESLKLKVGGDPVLLDDILSLTTSPTLVPLPLKPETGHTVLSVAR